MFRKVSRSFGSPSPICHRIVTSALRILTDLP
jgi:hypothetical protein